MLSKIVIITMLVGWLALSVVSRDDYFISNNGYKLPYCHEKCAKGRQLSPRDWLIYRCNVNCVWRQPQLSRNYDPIQQQLQQQQSQQIQQY